MVQYLLRVFTSWAIVAEVYYLPKMERRADESSIQFAERCKKAIAVAGGLVDRVWDGALKVSSSNFNLKSWGQIFQFKFK